MAYHSKCYKTVLFIAEKRRSVNVMIQLSRAEIDCANDNAQLACKMLHSTGQVIDWGAGRLLGNFLRNLFSGNDMPSSTAVASSDIRDNRYVLKSLQAENAKLRDRAVDIMLEIEKIREAKYGPGPRERFAPSGWAQRPRHARIASRTRALRGQTAN
jgi:hypothetical protein